MDRKRKPKGRQREEADQPGPGKDTAAGQPSNTRPPPNLELGAADDLAAHRRKRVKQRDDPAAAHVGGAGGCSTSADTLGAAGAAAGGGPSLPSALMLHCLELLPPNELACSGRLAFKDAAQRFSTPAHCTAHLSQQLPDHVADSWPALEGNASTALRSFTFKRKLGVLSTAAASGSETNMRVAWQLVQPCVFPELLRTGPSPLYLTEYECDNCGSHSVSGPAGTQWDMADPGTAAVRAGHVRLLRWMLEHRVPVSPNSTLQAAALCCSLAQLQEAAQLLQRHCRDLDVDSIWGVAEFAAASRTPDAQAKVEWLLRASVTGQAGRGLSKVVAALMAPGATARSGGSTESKITTALAVSAAAAGNLALLRWIWGQRARVVSRPEVLCAALEHAPGLEVAEWLLDEGGCSLPADRDPNDENYYGRYTWGFLSRCAAASGSVEKMRWLAARAGGPLHMAAADAAAEFGHLAALQYLQAEGVVDWNGELFAMAAGCGDIELVSWLRGQGCPMDGSAYEAAAEQGHVGMIRWLAQEGRCPGVDDPTLAGAVVAVWGSLREEKAGAAGGGVSAAGAGEAEAGRAAEAAQGVGGGGGGCGSGGGCLEALKILVAAGCPLGGSDTLDEAASSGDLGLVQYLHEQGMSFSHETLMCAAGSGCEALVEWLVREQGCRAGPSVECDPYLEAGERGDLAMLRCLRELGVPWHRRALRSAVDRHCKLPVVRWMVQHEMPAGREELAKAIVSAGQMGLDDVGAWLGAWREKAIGKKAAGGKGGGKKKAAGGGAGGCKAGGSKEKDGGGGGGKGGKGKGKGFKLKGFWAK